MMSLRLSCIGQVTGRFGSVSMWWLLLVLGLGGLSLAVLAWWFQTRKARRVERARLWLEHNDWVERSSRQDPP